MNSIALSHLIAFTFLVFGLVLSVSAQEKLTPYTENIEDSNIGIEMIPVKGGTFMMGSSPEDPHHNKDEGPAHKVEVSSFWMGKFEITWEQYELYMNSADKDSKDEKEGQTLADAVARPSKTYLDPSFGMGKEGYPAVSMTQLAALTFARWLSLKTGDFYRLPTEAEWEYACRANTSSAYHFGNDPSQLEGYAWFYENSDDEYHKVGSKKPNPWELYDMHGNVAEWTLDQYHEDYYEQFADKKAEDPWAKPQKLNPRTVRGGSWYHDADKLRCSARIPSRPRHWSRNDPQLPKSMWWYTNSPFVGFRLVRPINQPSKEEREKFWEQTLDQFQK